MPFLKAQPTELVLVNRTIAKASVPFDLTLQLHSSFDMSFLRGSLMSSSPE
jgi:hypothetical protein